MHETTVSLIREGISDNWYDTKIFRLESRGQQPMARRPLHNHWHVSNSERLEHAFQHQFGGHRS